MSLVLHIFKKDLLRLRIPLLVWLAALVFGLALNGVNASAVAGDFTMQSTVNVAQSLMAIIQLILLALMLPMLMHDEPLSGTTAFWQTRPIGKSDLLKAKIIFLILFLVLLPTLGKLSMLAASHVPAKYLALALPEILLKNLALALVFSTAAVLTRSFVHYAITFGTVFIAKLALDTGIYVARKFGAFPNLAQLTSISNQNENTVVLASILFSLGIIAHQVATRKTLRSYLLLALQIGMVAYLQSFKPFELALASNPVPLLEQAELGIPEATLRNQGGCFASDGVRSRPNDPAEKTIYGFVDYSGFPAGCFVGFPNKIVATLDVEGETLRMENDQFNNHQLPFFSKAEIEALRETIAPLELILGTANGSGLSQTLMRTTEKEYLRFKDASGIYSANIALNVFRHKTIASLPLAAGEEFTDDTTRVVIDAVIQESGGCSVILREQEISSALLPPRIQMHPSRFLYLLVNEKKGMAILAEQDSKKRKRPNAKLFSVQRGLHRFSVSNTPYQDVVLGSEWMAATKLMVIEPEWVAGTSVALEEDNFKMEAGRSYSSFSSQEKVDFSKITLPENPTRKDVEIYIGKIRRNINFMTAHNQTKVITEKYAAVGAENLDLLIEDEGTGHYAIGAIKQLATLEDKDLILKHLAENYHLVQVVLQFGWEDDAKDILIKRLNDGGGGGSWFLPPKWIRVVASYKDPETYPGLLDYFSCGMNPHSTYDAIKNLPGIDIEKVIAKAWRNSKYADTHLASSMAPIALEYGVADALGSLFGNLRSDTDWQQKSARIDIAKFTGQTGTDEELQAWHRAKGKQLQYDPETHLYFVEGEGIPDHRQKTYALIAAELRNLDLPIQGHSFTGAGELHFTISGNEIFMEGATIVIPHPEADTSRNLDNQIRTIVNINKEKEGRRIKRLLFQPGSKKVVVEYE